MIVTLDFETYYDRDYSLSKMSTVAYILDRRFQVLMCAVKLGKRPSQIYVGHDAIQAALDQVDWSSAALLSHNMRFDGAIALWHFHVRPKMYLCSLSMARATTHIAAGGSSLAKVAAYLSLPPKGNQVATYIGRRLESFSQEELADYGAYCLVDNDDSRMIFDRLRPHFPHSELTLIDLTLRMYIEPQVKLNGEKLASHLEHVRQERETAFATVANIERHVFSSQVKFAALLESLGVEVPMKISPTTGKEIPALAKNDRGFRDLCDDETQSPEVQAVLAARLGAKSTIEETRTASMLALSQLQWGNDHGWAPIPLKYYGAHTGRHSGDDGYNFLNLKRGSPIRDAIEAPEGHRVVHRDSSQIEARMVAWLASCLELLHAFAQGRDVYSEFASSVYGRKITKNDVGERFVGKTSILGLGYGMGAPRFRHTLHIGNGGISVKVTDEEANRIVYLYRRKYKEIPQLWNDFGGMALEMLIEQDPSAAGFMQGTPIGTHRPRHTSNALWLPNGMAIQYLDMRQERAVTPTNGITLELTYNGGPGKGRQRLFGGKVVENISQAYARIVITDIAVRVWHETGYRPFLCTYDSLDYVVPETEAPAFDAHLEREFARRVAWAPELPLASEGGWGRTLLEAERRVNA